MKKIRYIVRILIIDNLKIKTGNEGKSLNGTITNLFFDIWFWFKSNQNFCDKSDQNFPPTHLSILKKIFKLQLIKKTWTLFNIKS